MSSPVTFRGPKRLILAGALVTASGLAVAATAPVAGRAAPGRVEAQQSAGGLLVLTGWALLGLGIHRFGRERQELKPGP
jgi:hypothetical protein